MTTPTPPKSDAPKSDAPNSDTPSRDPLHGITLERMLTELVEHFGWEELGRRIAIRCFTSDPSIGSSLKFLRKTPWARSKVEGLYVAMVRRKARQQGEAGSRQAKDSRTS